MTVPATYNGLFQFWRFCYPVIDAIRETCFPPLMSAAESTVLRGVNVVTADDADRLRQNLNERLGAGIPSGSVSPEMNVAALCLLIGEHAPEPTEQETEGFFEEFPHLRD